MRVTKEMLENQVNWLNKQLEKHGMKYQLTHYNGYYHLETMGHSSIVVGTPKHVYEHIGTIRQVLWHIEDKRPLEV